MARVPWNFSGYDWAINPEKDSGWTPEHVSSEQVPINAPISSIQFGGTKAARRQIQGWVWGAQGPTQYNNMVSWHRNKTNATLTDHMGNTRRCILIKLEWEWVQDIAEWNEGRQTYKYTAEFVATES